MPRYIDADALENEVHTFCREFIVSYRDFRTKCALYDAMKGVLVRIYDAPTISPDEVRGVGKWMPAETELGFSCSVCGKLLDEYVHGGEWVSLAKMPNYCPNCGARMKGGAD